MEEFRPTASPFRDVYTISRLNHEAKALLEDSFPMLWVEGEISNLARPASGHVYFSLKDNQAQIRCALFSRQARLLTTAPRDGMQVLVRARVTLYEGRGEFQLIVEHLEDAGEGALRRAFEALKQRLAKEGLFDAVHKKPLPRLPRRIGIITSPSGAVLHDILTTLKRRFPAIPVLVYPVPVQGEGAAEKIVAAIQLAGQRRDCDALILARGGGSLEDLWSFNEEIVARAIAACPIPLVCGIGHETDFTIADLVADARAPTPTAAAEMLSPHQEEWLAQFVRTESRLVKALRDGLRNRSQHLDWLGARLVHPRNRIELVQHRLTALMQRLALAQTARLRQARADYLAVSGRLRQQTPQPRLQALQIECRHAFERLVAGMRRELDRAGMRTQQAVHSLNALSPLATLERGYTIITRADTGTVVTDARTINPGDRIKAKLSRGRIDCLVEKTHDD
jgi:exodeoxyribonuclease VII large subunit